MDYSLLGSPVCGISQAKVLEQVAISFSRSLLEPGIEPGLLHLLHLQADSLPLCHVEALPWEALPCSKHVFSGAVYCG